MSLSDRLVKCLVLAVVASGITLMVIGLLRSPSKIPDVKVQVPALSDLARSGSAAFETNCAQCHGKHASGTDKGPPLIHRVYHPGHHGDAAFFLAAKQGVRQHHWQFGHMPAQPEVTDGQLTAIVRFVREVQVANGIGTRPNGG